jgi:D-methionine transport system ATP-binding protein
MVIMQNRSSVFRLEDVSVEFASIKEKTVALHHVTLEVEKGDIYGIIGQSGAGKSTLIRCLAKLVKPTTGRVLFHGQDMNLMDREELSAFRKKSGMIFQHFNLLTSRTAAGNIALPLEINHMPQDHTEAAVSELLALVGLETKRNVHPSQLSGGEKQRVGIARALATHPEVLLCDEATSALDPKNTQDILNLLKKIHAKMGLTIVFITHQMEVVRQLATKVAVLDNGTIVERGAVTEVLSLPHGSVTKALLRDASHEIPFEFLRPPAPNRKLLRLHYKGENAKEPIISHLVRHYAIDVNIILGWIDRVQGITLGTLTIEATGEPENLKKALAFLEEQKVPWEEVVHEP